MNRVNIGTVWRIRLNDPMRPYVSLPRQLVRISIDVCLSANVTPRRVTRARDRPDPPHRHDTLPQYI